MSRFLLFAGLALWIPPQFEVASIRPATAAANSGTSVNLLPGGRIRIVNEPIKLLVRLAFRLQDSEIAGGPDWLDTDRYDIDARTGLPDKLTPDQLAPLIESLLRDRFQLKFHRETRELPLGALVLAKGAPKLKPSAEGEVSGMNTSGGRGQSELIGTAVTMDLLAKYLGNRLGRIVVDKTGLTGRYDFTLSWAPDEAVDSAPSLVTALREQLGLRLESQKSPVEVLVIDHIERPSAN